MRRKANRSLGGTDGRGDCLDNFESETASVRDGASPGIGAVVAVGLSELVDEVAVGPVDCNGVDSAELCELDRRFDSARLTLDTITSSFLHKGTSSVGVSFDGS